MNDSPAAVIVDQNGNPVEVVTVPNGLATDRYLGVGIVQDVHTSTDNSSTANLAANATFTGTGESCKNWAGIQVFVFADQPLRVTVQQSSDNSNWDLEDVYDLPENLGDGRVFQSVASYVRVVVQNVGNATTTDFRLQTLLLPTVEALPRSLTPRGALKLSKQTTGYLPEPRNFSDFNLMPSLSQDAGGHLGIRGQVLTDEESFRSNYTEGALYSSLTGTCYFRNGSDRVTGIGTSFQGEVKVGQVIKLSTDSDSVAVPIADVLSDTDLLLEEPYTGTSGNGTGSISDWYYDIGTGASVTVTASEMRLLSGTTSGTIVDVHRDADYLPLTAGFRGKVSQRIANQEIGVGFIDRTVTTVANQVAVILNGTDNTKVTFRTGCAPGVVEETIVTLPNGSTTAVNHDYVLSVGASKANFFVDRTLLATHYHEIPGPYDAMDYHKWIQNTGVPSGSTTLTLEYSWFQNFDQLAIGTVSEEPLVVRQLQPATPTTSNVTAAVADTLLLASNPNRAGASIYNDSTASLYVKLGSGASTTSFTVKLNKDDYYEIPYGYTGIVHGYWSSASGAARVTEMT